MGTSERAYSKRQQGLTLLEVLLATFILATVVSMITMSLSGSVEVVNATRDQGEVFHRAQVALHRISEDLASAMLVEDTDFNGSSGESVLGTDTPILSFASTAHVVFDPEHDHPGIARIAYMLVPDEENDQELLLLRADDRLAMTRTDDGEAEGYLLCDRLRSIRFSFLNQAGEEFDSWTTASDDTISPAAPKLPAAVTCTLELWLDKERDSSIGFTTSVLIPVGWINEEAAGNAP